MGETDGGKTTLIEKLNQILNNGVNLVGIIRIDPGFIDNKICEEIKIMNEKAKE